MTTTSRNRSISTTTIAPISISEDSKDSKTGAAHLSLTAMEKRPFLAHNFNSSEFPSIDGRFLVFNYSAYQHFSPTSYDDREQNGRKNDNLTFKMFNVLLIHGISKKFKALFILVIFQSNAYIFLIFVDLHVLRFGNNRFWLIF